MRNSLLGVVMLWEIDLLPFRKKVSGVQILLTIRLFSRRISMGPSNFSRSSIHVWRKNTSMVYSWTGFRVWVKNLFTTTTTITPTAGAASAPATTISSTPGEDGRWVCEPWFHWILLDGRLAVWLIFLFFIFHSRMFYCCCQCNQILKLCLCIFMNFTFLCICYLFFNWLIWLLDLISY